MSPNCFVFIVLILGAVKAQSPKKGLCVPPGTNFHCGDLSPFTNVRYILKDHRLPSDGYMFTEKFF